MLLNIFCVIDIAVEFSNCTHGSIRLAGALKSVSGTVEVCTHGVWGAVCDDGWDYRDANVACGQLGYLSFGKVFVCVICCSFFSVATNQKPCISY